MSQEITPHEGFLLHVSPTEYILNPGEKLKGLIFDRTTGDIRLSPHIRQLAGTMGDMRIDGVSDSRPIFGLLGTISLPTIDLIILITSAKIQAKFLGHPVYVASRFLLLPLTTREELSPIEGQLISLVYKHLEDGKFWFSYEMDITRNLQAQSKPTTGAHMWENADDRFFWNKYLQSRLTRMIKGTGNTEIGRFVLPVMYGSFDLRHSTVQSHEIQLAVISRRSRHRAGTRYFTRGVDSQGNPGNFNETEQILIAAAAPGSSKQRVASFVQTRGSAPFYWAEIVNLVFVPDLMIMDRGAESLRAFRAHMDVQTATYGKVLLLNLVKSRGREKHVKDAYEKMVKEGTEGEKPLQGVDYTYFDLHTETHGGRWYRVDEKTAEFGDNLKDYAFYEADADALTQPNQIQQGTVRTNCMDCLDRTNLMQTSVAKYVLNLQLHHFGILAEDQSLVDEPDLMRHFREVWSDHGNSIAKAYTGTGALRTDFTRTGIRTRKGVVVDKMTSLWRYIMNNHIDGYKQDAFDLMTGAWESRRDLAYTGYLLADKRPWTVRIMPYVLGFALFMVFATLVLPRTSSWPLLYPLMIWLSMTTVSGTYIVKTPNHYISWPRLNFQPTIDAMHYSGPGARTNNKKAVGAIVDKGEKTIIEEALKAE